MPTGSPEYCLFAINHWSMCMQKGEWSGWAQAFGSLLALAIALWLPIWARRHARGDGKLAVLAYLGQVDIAAQALKVACSSKDWASFCTQRKILEDAARVAAAIPVAALGPDVLIEFLAFRAAMIDLDERLAGHTPQGNWEYWTNEADSLLAGLAYTRRGLKKVS